MKYQTICKENLKNFGINILTGEACAFGMRYLCDLNRDGVDLLNDFYGIGAYKIENQNPFCPNMNSEVGDKPAIASCMISRNTLTDLYKFILFTRGWEVAVFGKNEWTGMTRESWDEIKEAWPDAITVCFNWKSSSQPSVGSRNIHAWTGRAI